MKAIEALLNIKDVIETHGDEKVKHSFYVEFHRRLLVLRLVEEYCQKGVVVDLGAQPFIVSCALKLMDYEVIAYDYDPEPYLNIAKTFGVKVVKCDLEQDSLSMEDDLATCVVFSEVIEHINPYYVNHVIAEINRILKVGGKLIITTPNIASLSRRIKLLLGMQPQYRFHVHEYTKKGVGSIVIT